MTGRTVESELKFIAADERPLDALAAAADLGPARLGKTTSVYEVDRYLDTTDLRLAAHHWACRLRERGGRIVISLKGPAEQAAGDHLHRRPEVEGPGGEGLEPSAWPPSAARDLLLNLADAAALHERFHLEQRRGERQVTVGGEVVGTLSLDRARVIHQGTEAGRLLVVELEMLPAALEAGLDVEPLATALGAIPGLRPDPSSKLEHALALLPGS